MTNRAVAELERLHDGTVKALDAIYMQQQVAEAGLPAPRAIGVDEIAIRPSACIAASQQQDAELAGISAIPTITKSNARHGSRKKRLR